MASGIIDLVSFFDLNLKGKLELGYEFDVLIPERDWNDKEYKEVEISNEHYYLENQEIGIDELKFKFGEEETERLIASLTDKESGLC